MPVPGPIAGLEWGKTSHAMQQDRSANERVSGGSSSRVVWILNHYAQVPSGPGGTRHFWLAKHLRSFGWEAVVVAASTELNTGRQRLEFGAKRELASLDGVSVAWLRVPSYRGNGLGRFRNMLTFALQAARRRSYKGLPSPDVVIGSSVHPLTAVAANVVARRCGVPFVFEIRDLWPETLIAFGRLRRDGIVARGMRVVERHLCRKASHVVTVLPAAWEYLCPTAGIPRGSVTYIPNGVELSDRPFIPPQPSQGRPFQFMYLGAHGQANDLETMLLADSILESRVGSDMFVVRFIGDGPRKADLVKAAQGMALSSVRFEPAVPSATVHQVAAEADAFLLTSLDCPGLYKFGVSMNKLFDYMAAGRPTAIAMDAANNPILEAQAGMAVRPQDPHALANAMESLLRMPFALRDRMGKSGRLFVERFHAYSVLAQRLAVTLDHVVAENLPA